jgi:hypothetical protein
MNLMMAVIFLVLFSIEQRPFVNTGVLREEGGMTAKAHKSKEGRGGMQYSFTILFKSADFIEANLHPRAYIV